MIGARKYRAQAVLFAALTLLAFAVVAGHMALDAAYPRVSIEKLLYLPSGKHLKQAVIGFDNMAADYYWLKTIGYFGQHYMADKQYPWLAHILNLVTDLDPRFHMAYYFGGIVLALEAKQVDASIALLRKGMAHFPGNWKYPFFIGFNYFYYQADYLQAAGYIEKAASIPGHPEYLPRLTASLYAKGGKPEDAVAFLETVLATVDDERLRANIREKIADLRSGRLPSGLDGIWGSLF